MDGYIVANADFKLIFTRLIDEDGTPLVLSDVDEFKLKIAESETTGTVVLTLSDSSQSARFSLNQSRAEVTIQILASDYGFAAGKEYYFQLFTIRDSITNSTPPRRFQVVPGIDPDS